MLLFLCINDLPPSDRNYSGDCFTASREVQACSESQLIGGWAVGGEVHASVASGHALIITC